MSKILDMRKKRGEIWDQAKAFLDAHQDENGVMSAEDTQTYERMEQEVVDLGHAIDRLERAEQMDRELNSDPANPMLTSRPDRSDRTDTRRGIASDAYKKAFWDQLRGKTSYEIRDALQVGELTEGGYTVPTEFENQLVEGLEEENIMRGLVHVITTSSGDRKIPLVTNYGNASWIEEEQQIPESDVGFGQVSLGAHKLATAIRISQELLNDSAFDMAAFITHEFQRRAGAAEEEAIIAGDGSHKPVGLLHDTLGAQVGVTAASATAITADELIDLQHSLKSSYRRKAAFIMNDATIKALRKLKDSQGQYLWQPSIREGVPDMLINTKIYMSNYMPLPEAGKKIILYGDYSYYWLADRAGRTLQRLNELYAMTDQVGFKLTERLDGRLILPEAVKVLQMKGA